MARHREENRDQVTSEYVALRLTPLEHRALLALVARAQATVDAAGITTTVKPASVMRSILKKEAMAVGVWPQLEIDFTPPATPPPPAQLATQAPTPLDTQMLLTVARTLADKQTGMVYVPQLVKSLQPYPLEAIHAALCEADTAMVFQLRPESGIGLLSKEDAALCPRGAKDSVLSFGLLIEATQKAPAPPPAAPDAAKLRARVERALSGKHKCFDTAAELARVADVSSNDVSRLRAGKGLSADKLVKIDAALESRGA